MPDFEHGIERIFSEVISGIIATALLTALAPAFQNSLFVLLFILLNIIISIALIDAMPYWGNGYILGWLVGVIILSNSGLVGIFDFILYIIPPLFIIYKRIKN
ncbi:MAG: hypothetical protein O8C63_05235 [Candidatus Methanoperedens sp.]|nr:hypothetical protein [Candidatus Methanoperedens sp.]